MPVAYSENQLKSALLMLTHVVTWPLGRYLNPGQNDGDMLLFVLSPVGGEYDRATVHDVFEEATKAVRSSYNADATQFSSV